MATKTAAMVDKGGKIPPRPAVPVGSSNSLNLDLRPGMDFQRRIWHKFNCPIAFTPGPGAREFFLVASFGHHKHRLDVDIVNGYLNACLGGIATDFNVAHLRDQTYCFSVFSMRVGFSVFALKSFECETFKVFFNLWGHGGPDYIREFHDWQMEELQSWSIVGKKKSYAQVTKDKLSGANRTTLGSRFARIPVSWSIQNQLQCLHIDPSSCINYRLWKSRIYNTCSWRAVTFKQCRNSSGSITVDPLWTNSAMKRCRISNS